MKILHLSESDIGGGAARGAYWLHKGLQQIGVQSEMLVAEKSSADPSVRGPRQTLITQLKSRIKVKLDTLPLRYYPNRVTDVFSPAWIPSNTYKKVQHLKPDLVNLHWVGKGFVKPENLFRFYVPLVWTQRDMWAFTGGCYYAEECEKYSSSCGSCPQLKSDKQNDLSRRVWSRKLKAWQNFDLTIVAISHWLADCARHSSLFKDRRIEVIHNALDPSNFKPVPKQVARNVLNLSPDKKIIAFGAMNAINDKRKGFEYLSRALKDLSSNGWGDDTEALIFGASEPLTTPDLGLKTTFLGRIYDDPALVLIYSAADVMVVPSIQEAFGKTAIEAMACGTPVVSFDTSGLKDIVEHKQCGYRAECYKSEYLAEGIAWVLDNEFRWKALSHRSRQKVEQEFSLNVQAKRYKALYEDILASQLARDKNGIH